MSCPCHECHATQLAAILIDLIAELRELHCMTHDEWHGELLSDSWCLECRNRNGELVRWPCQTIDIADRAEARLREVQGE